MGTKLSVNVNKVATLRNARGGNVPDVVRFAIDCERFGADGITVHPRPDERHITTADVYALKEVVTTEFNIEGYPDDRYMSLIRETRPAQATLVPDPPDVLTSNAGWDTRKNQGLLSELSKELKSLGVRSSIFVDTKPENIEFAAKCGVDRIELYTGPYAEEYTRNPSLAIANYVEAAIIANKLGLGINGGHDLSLDNIGYFKDHIPELLEVSIGHALISEALYLGLENTIQLYLSRLKD